MYPDPLTSGRRGVAQQSPLLPPADEELLARFLDRAPMPLVVADDHRALRRVNGPWVELTGYTPDRALGMRIDDLLAPDSRSGLDLRWADLIKAGAATARVAIIRADGSRL